MPEPSVPSPLDYRAIHDECAPEVVETASTPERQRLTGRAALEAWPERMRELRADPSDETLQRLCSLLDTVDGWIVARWGKDGHQERRSQLKELRKQAREAATLVYETRAARTAERGMSGGLRAYNEAQKLLRQEQG
jgi:hypothetical protein